ncbi:MAG TPA: hypothetical protein VG056_02560, partial [Pirellulales bacterium]|nr:hypothetical protein [Pirellulales bacterium]
NRKIRGFHDCGLGYYSSNPDATNETDKMAKFFGPNLVYASMAERNMGDIIGSNGEVQFANGQNSRDLRVRSGDPSERTESPDPLQALRRDSDEAIERRVEWLDGTGQKPGTSGGSPSHRGITKRVVLLVLLASQLEPSSPSYGAICNRTNPPMMRKSTAISIR